MNEKIEKAIKPILKMYTDIETELLLIIANHFKYEEQFYNSDYWRIKKLEEMGLFNKKVVKFLSKYAKKNKKVVLKALEEIGIESINKKRFYRLFKEGKVKINPKILENNYTIKNIINYAYDDLSGRLIQMSDKIEKSVRKAYLDIVESAYLKTSMGTHSYAEAIRSAIDDLSNRGLTILTYKTTDENGNIVGIRNYDIEGAVRRETLTAARQLSGNVSIEVANQLECEYVYLSEHLRCRPSHFDWQGTIIKREDLIKVTHYGEVDGLYGINCAHYVEPYFGHARGNELKKFSKEECKEAYDLSQHQRYLERGIRKWKRKEEMYKVNGDEVAYAKSHDKRLEWQKRIQDFTNENNLRRDFNREYVKESDVGLGAIKENTLENHTPPKLLEKIDMKNKKNIEKTLKYYENQIKDSKIENAIVITSKGDVYQCFGNKTNVWPDVDLGEELLNAYVTHNHIKEETYFSFSSNDINLFEKYNLTKLRGIDYKYTYEFDRSKKPKLKMLLFGEVSEDIGLDHISNIQYALKNNIYYMRWENDK